MTHRLFLFLAAGTLVVGSAGWAVAAGSHSVDVRLESATLVNGTLLPAGDYNFSWMSEAGKVDVTIEQVRKVVAKAQAKVEERPQAAREEEVITRTSKSGSRALEELRMRGERTVLVFPVS